MEQNKNVMARSLACPVCRNHTCNKIMSYYDVPIMQNFPEKTEEDARKSTKGNINLYICINCGFIFNADYNENLLKYSEGYDNNRDFSIKYNNYIKSVHEFIDNNVELKNKKILEVGCGNGSFLEELCLRYGCEGYGYDPAYVGKSNIGNGHVHCYSRYYEGLSPEEINFDLVILRHTIEHLLYPSQMLLQLRNSMTDQGRLYIETPCFDWILRNSAIFDIFYEHCSYYTRDSIRNLFTFVNLSPVAFDYNFNNQYMCVIAKKSNQILDLDKVFIKDVVERAKDFNRNKLMLIQDVQNYLKSLKMKGNIGLWGAAAKGTSFCHIFDSDKQLIKCLVDVNIKKQGKYIPLTGHEIISPSSIYSKFIKYIILTNSVYYDEIKNLVENIDNTIELIELEKLISTFIV